jgi:hypothetical protein
VREAHALWVRLDKSEFGAPVCGQSHVDATTQLAQPLLYRRNDRRRWVLLAQRLEIVESHVEPVLP